MVGAYRGSRSDKVQALCGLNEVGVLMQNKRVRWAAPVYVRHMPKLRLNYFFLKSLIGFSLSRL